MNATIRRLDGNGGAEYQALMLEFLALQKSLAELERIRTMTVQQVGALLRRHYAAGAFDAGLIGAATLLYPDDEKTREPPWTLRLGNVYVRAEHRGQGIAKGILRRLLADAERSPFIDAVELQAEADNEAAVGLYHALGFRFTDIDRRSGAPRRKMLKMLRKIES